MLHLIFLYKHAFSPISHLPVPGGIANVLKRQVRLAGPAWKAVADPGGGYHVPDYAPRSSMFVLHCKMTSVWHIREYKS